MERNVRLLGFGALFRALGISMIFPFVSLYLKNTVGIDYAEIGVLFVFVGIVPLLVSPFGGLVADRAGRRRVFLLAIVGESASILLIGYSMQVVWIPGVLAFAAAANIAGGALGGPANSAYVADLAEGAERSKGYSFQRITFNLGFTVGAFLGGFLTGSFGFPAVGYISSAILAAATVFLFATLAPSPYDTARKNQGEVSTVQAGPGTVSHSLKVLAEDRRFLLFSAASTLAALTYGQWAFTFPLFIKDVLALPYWVVGTAISLNGLIVVVAQAPITRIMTGSRHTTSASISILLYAIGFIVLGAISFLGVGYLLGAFAFVLIVTIGENFGAIPFMTLPSNMAPETERGSYNGAFNTLAGVGGVLAPLFGGAVLGANLNPLLTWVIIAIPTFPAALLFLWLGRRISKQVNTV